MNSIRLYITTFLLLLCYGEAFAESEQDNLDRHILRVSVEAFVELPPDNIFKRMGCSIPQVGIVSRSGNYPKSKPFMSVVQGEFARKGQKDWAILCSRNRISSIVLMWGGEVTCSLELAPEADKGFLQGLGGDGVLYSRSIDKVQKEEINQQYKNWGGQVPSSNMDHDGLNDIFENKASIIYYCDHGKWLELSGYD